MLGGYHALAGWGREASLAIMSEGLRSVIYCQQRACVLQSAESRAKEMGHRSSCDVAMLVFRRIHGRPCVFHRGEVSFDCIMRTVYVYVQAPRACLCVSKVRKGGRGHAEASKPPAACGS